MGGKWKTRLYIQCNTQKSKTIKLVSWLEQVVLIFVATVA